MNELTWTQLRGQELHQQAEHYRLVQMVKHNRRVRRLPLLTILLGLLRR